MDGNSRTPEFLEYKNINIELSGADEKSYKYKI